MLSSVGISCYIDYTMECLFDIDEEFEKNPNKVVNEKFPPITFHIGENGDIALNIQPEDYIYSCGGRCSKHEHTCCEMLIAELDLGVYLLGAPVINTYYTIFD